MGFCAEKTATDFKITREENDKFCINSYEKTLKAIKEGKYAGEIVPIKISETETVIKFL